MADTSTEKSASRIRSALPVVLMMLVFGFAMMELEAVLNGTQVGTEVGNRGQSFIQLGQ